MHGISTCASSPTGLQGNMRRLTLHLLRYDSQTHQKHQIVLNRQLAPANTGKGQRHQRFLAVIQRKRKSSLSRILVQREQWSRYATYTHFARGHRASHHSSPAEAIRPGSKVSSLLSCGPLNNACSMKLCVPRRTIVLLNSPTRSEGVSLPERPGSNPCILYLQNHH